MSELNPDDFLRGATRRHENNEGYERIIENARSKCDEVLAECGVSTAFRYDAVEREKAIKKYRALLYKALKDEYSADQINGLIQNKYIAHLAIITEAVTVRINADYALANDGDINASVDEKKRLMARLIVFYGMRANDPWMAFVDAYLDGEPLDFNSPDVALFLAEAQRELDEIE